MSTDNNSATSNEVFRRSSYQKDTEAAASAGSEEADLRGNEEGRSLTSRRRRPSSSASTSRRSRTSRGNSIIMTIRRAFNIEYEPTDLDDVDGHSLDDEIIAPQDGNPRYCRYVFGLILILGVLVIAPAVSKRRRTDPENNMDTTLNPAEAPSMTTAPTPSLPPTASLLGTCRDPIRSLKDQASIENLPHGAVAADHPLCSEMGTAIMRDHGGNAVDAAVSVALCLGVANPASSGIGGGGFILIHADATDPTRPLPSFHDARSATTPADSDSGKVTEVVDCREVAPSAAYTNMFLDTDDEWASTYGGLSAGVPAELRGLELAHARHGKLSWADVVRPVVQLAREGAPINGNLAHEIYYTARSYDVNDPGYGLRKLLTHNDDWTKPLREGELLKNDKLADTLEAIMNQGADALYKGERAASLAQDIQNARGVITKEDIEGYIPTLRSPVVAHDIQGYSIAGVPPPSSGGAVIVAIARFLAGYETPFSSFADTLSMHRYVEACRHAFAMRMSLSDPDYNTKVVDDVVKDMVEGEYIADLRKATHDNTTLPLSKYGGAKWAQLNDTDGGADAEDAREGDRRQRRRRLWREFGYLEDHGTSHFSVVDADGNAVAMTTSVNMYFGSGIVSESTGIIVNNQMDDFSTPGRPNGFGLEPSESNYIKPGKKPLSSMSPTLVFRKSNSKPEGSFGELLLVLGASGGPKIITAVVQVFLNHIILGMPLFESIIRPRVHDQLIYHESAVSTVEESKVENGDAIILSNRTKAALRARHHRLLKIDYMGTVQAVSVDLETNTLSATCDVRKGGSPAGY